MKNPRYCDLLMTPGWTEMLKRTISLLKFENCTVVGLPFCGRRFFLRCVAESYRKISRDSSTVISFQLLADNMTVADVDSRICQELQASFGKTIKSHDAKIQLQLLMRKKKRVLIIIDMFEHASGAYAVLNYLESLRSINPLNIRFLLAAGLDLLSMPEHYQTKGGLIANNILILPPYSYAECTAFIKANSDLHQWRIPVRWHKKIYQLSGGNPGLIKYICKHIDSTPPRQLEPGELLENLGIHLKLNELHELLTRYQLLQREQPNRKYQRILEQIGLITADGSYKIQIFANFMQQLASLGNPGSILSAQEYKVFQVFQDTVKEFVTLDEIAEQIWGSALQTKYSLWSLYKLISNINKKIHAHHLVIQNARGRGYYLTQTA